MTPAYPLQWPEGWPRTPPHKRRDGRAHFRRPDGAWTVDAARRELVWELERLGARDIVISTDLPLRRDGWPRASARADDPGVAVYFTLGGRQLCMAADWWAAIEHNMRALALAIAGLRQMQRHGGAQMLERAFRGFEALPSSDSECWWVVLGVPETASWDQIQAAWRAKVREARLRGDEETVARLNIARDRAKEALG